MKPIIIFLFFIYPIINKMGITDAKDESNLEITLEEGVFYNMTGYIEKGIELKLLSWDLKSFTGVEVGKYALKLYYVKSSKEGYATVVNKIIELGELEFRITSSRITTSNIENKWIYIAAPPPGTIGLYLTARHTDTYNELLTKQATYQVIIRNPNTFTVENCLEESTNNCQINPLTQSNMLLCLNWRRSDEFGTKCKFLLKDPKDTGILNASMQSFCSKNVYSEDCKCINRQLYDDLKDTNNLCSSGTMFLTEKKVFQC